MADQDDANLIRYGRHNGELFMVTMMDADDGQYRVALVSVKGVPSTRIRGGRGYTTTDEAFAAGAEIAKIMLAKEPLN